MRFISSHTKTLLSVSSAFILAVVLAGCSTPPDSDNAPATEKTPVKTDNPQKVQPRVADKNPHSITWLTSYDKALATAKSQYQAVLVDFYADWCEPCKMLDRDVYSQPDVVKESKKFVNLKINFDKDTNIAERFKVYSLPTMIFLDGNGKVLWRLEGVPTTPHFIQTLQKVQDKLVDEA
jgi:thiol:disulfide interchange protein